MLAYDLSDGGAAQVHEGLRTNEQQALFADVAFGLSGLVAAPPKANSAVCRQRGHHAEAQVVARLAVTEAWIAKSDYDLHFQCGFGGQKGVPCGRLRQDSETQAAEGFLREVEPPARLERAARALGGPCSIHLSYGGLCASVR